jgi:adenylate cyclase
MRRLLKKHGIRWAAGLALVAVACIQALGMLPTVAVDRMDTFIYDMRMRAQPAVMDERIVIVDIDEKSVTEIGRWPWSRDAVAGLVARLTDQYQAAAVGFDVVFAEPDTSSGYATLEALARNELKDVDRIGARIEALRTTLDYDGLLAAALKERPVVLGYYLSNEKGATTKGLLPPPAFTATDVSGYRVDALRWNAYNGNLDRLQRAAPAGGFFNPLPDEDGVIRRLPLLGQYRDGYYESLALATVRMATGATAVYPVFPAADVFNSEASLRRQGYVEALMLNAQPRKIRIPLEPALTVLIPFHGRGGPDGGNFNYVSAADVLKGRIAPDALRDRIVLVGTTVQGLKDLRTSPVSVDFPGVEMHANVMRAILDGEFKQRPDTAVAFELVQAAVAGVLLVAVLPLLSPLFSIAVTLAALAGVTALNFWMYQSLDLVLPLASALLLIVALFVFNLAWGYLFEYRKGRAIVNLFGEYVAPELVARMAEDPARYNMDGESRELTVLFADVRGFTTISEGLQPNELREYINLYLTAMSEDIRGNRGTLDKYIGDAVMAFWGAPVALPDHAALAVATALKMQATAARLDREFAARGWPPLKIGIGLNTGEMRVGDMGSKIRRAYTVMGDAVNLGSRLEGITKAYGVGLVVGEATMLAAPQFAYRELDRVRVKGKNEPVPVFEPVGAADELDDAQRAALGRWHDVLAQVRAQRWDAAEEGLLELQFADPQDGLYALYLARVAHYRIEAPGFDWDGVTTFETK